MLLLTTKNKFKKIKNIFKNREINKHTFRTGGQISKNARLKSIVQRRRTTNELHYLLPIFPVFSFSLFERSV